MSHTLIATKTLIEIYQFRIERDLKTIELYDHQRRECQRIYKDCGTLTHQIRMENQIKELGKLILLLEKEVKKHEKLLEKEKEHLLYLTNQKTK